MTATYWEIGRRIVKHEQQDKSEQPYGEELLTRLSTDLTKRFGRGFSADNLERARKFYLTFYSIEKSAMALRKSQESEVVERLLGIAERFLLPWSHYTRMLPLRSAYAVEFYHTEAVRGG